MSLISSLGLESPDQSPDLRQAPEALPRTMLHVLHVPRTRLLSAYMTRMGSSLLSQYVSYFAP